MDTPFVIAGRTFASPADFNAQLWAWLPVANQRNVRRIGCAPAARWETDRAAMLALPPVPLTLGWRHQVRLPRPYNFKASPVGANGKIYLASEQGDVIVLKMSDKLEVLATNTLEDQIFIASPVIVEGEIFLRSQNTLYCISENKAN